MLALDDGMRAIVPLWPEVLVGAAAFAVLAYVLVKVVFPRMEQVIDARADAIDGGLARAEAVRAEAEEIRDRYREKLARARVEAAEIREAAQADAARTRAAALESARAEAEAILAAGRERLAAERAAVHRSLHRDVWRLAAVLAERIVH